MNLTRQLEEEDHTLVKRVGRDGKHMGGRHATGEVLALNLLLVSCCIRKKA